MEFSMEFVENVNNCCKIVLLCVMIKHECKLDFYGGRKETKMDNNNMYGQGDRNTEQGQQQSTYNQGYQQSGYNQEQQPAYNQGQQSTYNQGYQQTNYNQTYQQPYNQPYQQSYQTDSDLEEPVTFGDWMLSMIVMTIPCVNLIMMFVWAFGSGTKKSKANYFKATLVWMLIWIVLSVIMMIGLGGAIASIIGSGNYY